MITNQDRKPPGYHSTPRHDIAALIPGDAKNILELGCGTGELGKNIKARQDCRYTGIDMNKQALDAAKGKIDGRIHTNIEMFKPHPDFRNFDCLVCADILEHTIDPWNVLKKYADLLTDNATIIASIPNTAFPSVTQNLIRGLFRYQPAGLLDITHLRFFTQTSIYQLFARANLKITSFKPHPDPRFPYQFLITAKKLPRQEKGPMATIIMLSFNTLDFTKQAVQSIREYTSCPYKLIVVDQGSRDGTQDWLHQQPDILSIHNPRNYGFPLGNNLAIELVETPYTVIANSDIIVTPGWLCDLIETAESDPKIGIVGPITNYVSGPQRDPNAHYDNMAQMQNYAGHIQKRYAPRLKPFPRTVFFCTLIRSELFQKIGLLDEAFGLGNFEDDDFCLRTAKAGYKAVIDRWVFIHHFGHASFQKNRIDFAKTMKTNKAYFLKKWGIPPG